MYSTIKIACWLSLFTLKDANPHGNIYEKPFILEVNIICQIKISSSCVLDNHDSLFIINVFHQIDRRERHFNIRHIPNSDRAIFSQVIRKNHLWKLLLNLVLMIHLFDSDYFKKNSPSKKAERIQGFRQKTILVLFEKGIVHTIKWRGCLSITQSCYEIHLNVNLFTIIWNNF